ncbi:sorting nexin-12 isoform X2 [Danio rerio]|uniref:Sorting nexin-12 isoform X2 n=2 Tax=Danio rerio TaxID=7955 RepID=A0AC58I899_DANRE
MSEATVADTRRLNSKPQDLTDAYGPPSNFLEIDVYDPQTIGVGRNRFTTYEVRMRTNLPIFKLKESVVRRRYSDFEWLKNELERDSKIVVPPLPGKALKRQLPFRGDEGIFEESFIEERRAGLEQFINRIAGHPLAQNERCLHMFLQDESIDRNYIPGKVRQTKRQHLFHPEDETISMLYLYLKHSLWKEQAFFADFKHVLLSQRIVIETFKATRQFISKEISRICCYDIPFKG